MRSYLSFKCCACPVNSLLRSSKPDHESGFSFFVRQDLSAWQDSAKEYRKSLQLSFKSPGGNG